MNKEKSISFTRKEWTAEDKERFRKMCFEGASNKEIAEAFGVSLVSVQHRRSRWGLTMLAVEKAKAAAEADAQTGESTEAVDNEDHIDPNVKFIAGVIIKIDNDISALKESDQRNSQCLAEMKKNVENLQTLTSNLTNEIFSLIKYLRHSGFYRLLHRYVPLCMRDSKGTTKKEANHASND